MDSKSVILPILILLNSFVLNIERFDESLIAASIHVFLQSSFIWTLIVIFQRSIVIRSLWALFIAISTLPLLAYQSPLSISLIMSLLNTTPHEAFSFFQFNPYTSSFSLILLIAMILFPVPKNQPLVIGVGLVGLMYIFVPGIHAIKPLLSSPYYEQYYARTGLSRGYSKQYTAVEFVIGREFSHRFPPLKSFRGIVDTFHFLSQQTSIASSWTNVTKSDNSPDILVLGIGESLRAQNMQVYGYNRQTTPKLSKLASQSELIVYPRAYAAGTNTWVSIPSALTKVTQSNDLSKSIINLAKEAGYKTYWFSNQAQLSVYDFTVSAIANQADHSSFISPDQAGLEYDSALIPKLRKTLSAKASGEKLFIVLHFYGSHMEFSDRYPDEYAQFNATDSRLDDYDNSVLYTDALQAEIIDIVSEYAGQYIFFADHGLGNPDGKIPFKHDGRNPPSLDSISVPLLVAPSDNNLSLDVTQPISLYYFECIFSSWAKITATELTQDNYCSNALNLAKITFVDSHLNTRHVTPP
jgi:heptose-I-phosphate ethanolaminephosphotransferase